MTRLERFVPLLLGVAALALGTAAGGDPGLLRTIVTPLPLVRVALVGATVVLGLWLLGQAFDRIGRAGGVARGPGGVARVPGGVAGGAWGVAGTTDAVAEPADGIDIAVMLRGIRLVFLGLAAFAAAGGWLLADPLPLVVAAVIAGIDVVETSFLLLVLAVRGAAAER